MEYTIGLVLFLVVAGFASYIAVMIFWPEWVGITGKSAKKTLASHEEGSEPENDLMSKL